MERSPSYGVSYFDEAWITPEDINLSSYESSGLAAVKGTFLKREIAPDTYKYYYLIEELVDADPTTSQFYIVRE